MSRLPPRWSPLIAFGVGSLFVSGIGTMRGDDLVTLSGTTYHDVHPVRVEPDGVTWQYDEGVCKVDFTDSPKKVCADYHYDPVKAAAYHESQTLARRQVEEQNRQVLQDNEARRLAHARAAVSDVQAPGSTAGRELIFRRAASPAASEATRALGGQMEAAAAKAAVRPTGVFGAVARSPAGTVLSMLGVSFYQGPSILNQDASLSNPGEFRGDLHHSPSAAAAPDAAHDPFYTPVYMTKSYYEDQDRADAFARGVPLKP